MSAASQVHPLIGIADVADCALPGANGQTVRQIYGGQKHILGVLLHRIAIAECPHSSDRESAATLLHNLAGTAAYFGEGELGKVASELEFPLRETGDRVALARHCARLLAVLGTA